MTLKQLKEKAEALAKELGEEIKLDGKSKDEVSDMIGDLNRDLKSRAETSAAKEPDEVKKCALVVADGKSITSLKGIIGAGGIVKPEYFSTGKDALDELVKSGAVVKQG